MAANNDAAQLLLKFSILARQHVRGEPELPGSQNQKKKRQRKSP